MPLAKVQLMEAPGGPGVTGAVKAGTGITISPDGTISAQTGPGGGDVPAGSIMFFANPAAPTGWTKNTTSDNIALRLVSGTGGGTGGSVSFTTAFASQSVTGSVSLSGLSISGVSVSGTVGSTTLIVSQIPSHQHSFNQPVNQGANIFQGGSDLPPTVGVGANTSETGGSGSHTHTFSGSASGGSVTGSASFTGNAINMAVQYIDVISCTKN